MPAFSVPDLDTLDFEGLYEEARGLVVRFAPSWTDHNLHDPGITFLDLVAWLVDQQIYQAGFVSDRHIEAFAALLGVRRRRAVPSRGFVWPANDPGAITSTVRRGVLLPKNTAAVCVEQPELPFELSHDVYLSDARTVEAAGGTRSGGRTNGGGVELRFDRPLVEGDANAEERPVALGIEVAEDDAPPLREAPRARLVADYRAREDRDWRRVEIIADLTCGLRRSGVVLVGIPPRPPLSSGGGESRLRLRTRLALPAPAVRRAQVNVLPLAQLETRTASVVGTSAGLPSPSFELELVGLVAESITIEVAEHGRLSKWFAVPDLADSGPSDNHFELNAESNRVTFGNGVNGHIPPAGAQILHEDYALTRGAQGNVTRRLRWRVRNAPTVGGSDVYGTNPRPFEGGADASTVEDLRAEARERALTRRVLLTDRDLREAATRFRSIGVERAEVLNGFHPGLPTRRIPGARAVVLTRTRERSDPPPARPDPVVSMVAETLRPDRVLGERLTFIGVVPVPVTVKAKLLIEDGEDVEGLRERATDRLDARLSDVRRNADVEPWPPGRTVTAGELKSLLVALDGVVAVPELEVSRLGDELGKEVALRRDEVAVGQAHRLSIERFRRTRG